jgi:hypothetical protein
VLGPRRRGPHSATGRAPSHFGCRHRRFATAPHIPGCQAFPCRHLSRPLWSAGPLLSRPCAFSRCCPSLSLAVAGTFLSWLLCDLRSPAALGVPFCRGAPMHFPVRPRPALTRHFPCALLSVRSACCVLRYERALPLCLGSPIAALFVLFSSSVVFGAGLRTSRSVQGSLVLLPPPVFALAAARAVGHITPFGGSQVDSSTLFATVHLSGNECGKGVH